MVNRVTVPNFSQYNFAIGDTTEVVTKQNGVNAALQQFGNSLNTSIDQFNDDVEFVDTARQELDADNIVHAPGSGLPNEAGSMVSRNAGEGDNEHRNNQQNDSRFAQQSGDYANLRARATTYTDVGAPPTSRTVSAGDGLSGGGSLADNRTLSVDSSVVRTSRTITAGDGLTGGGNLTANLTLSVNSSVARTGTADGQVRTNSQNDARFVGAGTVTYNQAAWIAREGSGVVLRLISRGGTGSSTIIEFASGAGSGTQRAAITAEGEFTGTMNVGQLSGQTTNWVLERTSFASAGSVGSYAFCVGNPGDFGGTASGSTLSPAGIGINDSNSSGSLNGTWRRLGSTAGLAHYTVWLRIS